MNAGAVPGGTSRAAPERRYQTDLMMLPFFEAPHRALVAETNAWAAQALAGAAHEEGRDAVDARCRQIVASLGAAGLTRYCVRREFGGALPDFDARAICLIRETLAYHDGLADFAFAMQGLGSGAISLAGAPGLQARYLPRIARGEAIAAFALSEPDAGSDVAAMTCRAVRDGEDYVLDGGKTWISNGGIADFYCVFARTQAGQIRADGSTAAQGISAFVVEASDAGLHIVRRIDVNAPHPLAQLEFRGCRIPAGRLIGAEGEGFKIAMRTLDVFRASVAAAALGLARRALEEAAAHATQRRMFGKGSRGFSAHPGRSGRHGDGHRRRGTPDLPGCVAARQRKTRDPRRRHGEDGGHRVRSIGDRSRAADVRRARCRAR